jgi:hypothetical protein
MADEKILNIILDNVKELKADVKEDIKQLRNDMNDKFEKIEKINKDMVKKNECEEIRENCNKPAELELLKSEWSYKKIIAIGGIITGTLTASTAAIVSILKIVYG